MQRTEKLKLLDSIVNQGSIDSLKSLSRGNFPKVLIFEPHGEGILFNGRLNDRLPKPYQDKILDDKELDTMLLTCGNGTMFLLPENGRD